MASIILDIHYNKKQVEDIGLIKSFEYTDEASDRSDSITVGVDNLGSRWTNTWAPELNDLLNVTMMIKDKEKNISKLNCGDFIVDDFNISAPPSSCQLNATSTPNDNSVKAETKTKIWKSITLGEIAKEIAGNGKLELFFDADDTSKIKSQEQKNQTDLAFLSNLCKEYSLEMKVYSKKNNNI